jgi:hypothetical protein
MASLIPGRTEFRSDVLPVDAVETDLLFIPVFGSDDVLSDCPGVDAAVDGEWRRVISNGEFTGKSCTAMMARVARNYKATHICFIGAGARTDADRVRWLRLVATWRVSGG